MYETVWDKVINERQIDLVNETYFDENVTAVIAPENIVGIEGFKAYYNNYLTGFSDAEFAIIDAFGQGDKIVKHPNIKAISFTGGTKTGKIISKTASSLLKKVSLELGGKNPIIIFDDCNYKKMLDTTIRSSFENPATAIEML